MDEYPPGVRAPGEGYTGPIADREKAMRGYAAFMAEGGGLGKFDPDSDAPVKAYLSARDVWQNPWKYAGYPRPEPSAPARVPDASAPPPAQQTSQPPATPSQPDPHLIPAQARGSVEYEARLVRSVKSTTPRGYPAPVNPLGVFIAGTPENEA